MKPAEPIESLISRALHRLIPHWGIRDVAKRAGVSERTLHKYLANEGGVKLDRLEAIAHGLGLETWQILLPDVSDGVNAAELSRLVAAYRARSPAGRTQITEMAAQMM